MKRLSVICFVAISLTAIALRQTDRFSVTAIQIPLAEQEDMPSDPKIEIPRTFHYLSRGRQVFVFESGEYVLKLFNRNELKKPFRAYFPFPETALRRWHEKVRIFPESYPIALRLLSQDTGVLIAHLGKSAKRYPVVELIDRANRHFWIDLNKVPFVLQKKGAGSFFEALKGDQIHLDQMVDSYLDFHARRIQAFIADHDRDFQRNYCWDGSTIQYIDPARCYFEPRLIETERFLLEWWKATHRLRKWISTEAPGHLEHFDQKLQASIQKTDRMRDS